MLPNRCICFAMLVGLLWGLANAIQAADPSVRTVTDMAGCAVALPEKITRVVTLGEGQTILNGLADFGHDPHWKYQMVFAPHLAHLPTMQHPNREPIVETILLTKPDVVLPCIEPASIS